MPTGFQSLVAGTSIVQIDADGPPVLQLVTYGIIPMTSTGTGYRTAYLGLPSNLNPYNILIFIKPGLGGQATISSLFINSTGIFFESDINQTTLEYYIFGPPVSSNFGLELRNSNGTLVFSSNNKPCIIENLWPNVSYSNPPTMLVDANTVICSKNDVSFCYATGPGPPGPGGAPIGFTNYYRRKLPYYSGNNVLWKIISAMDTFKDSFVQASIGDVSTSTVISTKIDDININSTNYNIQPVNWPDVTVGVGSQTSTSTQLITGNEIPVILNLSYTSDGFPLIYFSVDNNIIVGSNVLVYPGQNVGFVAQRFSAGSNTVTVKNLNTDTILDTFIITFQATGTSYNISASTPVSEGSSSTCTVTTANVADGTILYWTVLNGTTQNADFSTTSGSFTVNSNSGSFTVPIVADLTTEGNETFSVQISTSEGGSIVATSNTVTINDTSTTPGPTYSASATTPVNEGSSSTCTVTTTNVANGTTLYWTVLNGTTQNADFSTTSGSFTVNSNSGSFSIPIVADLTTEGNQTFSVQIRTGSTSGTVVATSNTVTINDTSTTPAGDVTPDPVNWNNIIGFDESSNNSQTISGITQNITLRFDIDIFTFATITATIGGTPITIFDQNTISVSNNTSIFFTVIAEFGNAEGTITVVNTSDNNTPLDSFTFSVNSSGGGGQ